MPKTREARRITAVRRSIRARIVALLSIPIAALVVLLIFSTSATISSAKELHFQQASTRETRPAAGAMLAELQRERSLSLVFLGRGRGDSTELAAQRSRVDIAVRKVRVLWAEQTREHTFPRQTALAVADATSALESIGRGRESVDSGQLKLIAAMRFYNRLIATLQRACEAFGKISHPQATEATRPILDLAMAAEALEREDALISGVLAAGGFDSESYGELVGYINVQRFQFERTIAELPSSARSSYHQMTQRDEFKRVTAAENSVLSLSAAATELPPELRAWPRAYPAVGRAVFGYFTSQQQRALATYQPLARAALLRVAASVGLGLLAIVMTVMLSIRIGRSLIGRLATLHTEVIELAEHQLPATIARLRKGEAVDVAAEAPQLDFGDDEIGEVGTAFNAVRHAAIAAAVEEANLRRGMNQVFLNIARRSQSLLHRQLAALDAMERRATKPTDLQELFRIDHMAARMRRHAENLVILTGAAPSRRWPAPAPVIDLLRGAISEVEGYERVGITNPTAVSINGCCVVDLIHLLAELIENAASFSPPHTPVRLTGQRVPKGYSFEIEDRGIGMTPDLLAATNERLASPPAFDPSDSDRLGLFVVSKLASRHAIQVGLRPSPYGGLTAVVVLSHDLLVESPGAPTPTAPDQPGEPAASSGRPPIATAEPAEHLGGSRPDSDGLPRRIRQTNLSPHLRKEPDGARAPATRRSPADVRSRMSKFQAGTLRGRAQAATGADPGWDGDAPGLPTQRRPGQATEGEDSP